MRDKYERMSALKNNPKAKRYHNKTHLLILILDYMPIHKGENEKNLKNSFVFSKAVFIVSGQNRQHLMICPGFRRG
jgi:hypothetical protein